ncbi:deoxynucleoside kinase [Methylophilaceae bacterium]|jgi:deoxyadenosine/deoxycytidine kinase|nr:deoxynucleoside kinase [Betaproteobacteria bacterium]MDA7751614.1 deoxynucleoside kinase [Methylophilaceae bacterium]MCH9841797.1 deoxynucleoside kinase [Betaproteobacteria bacterium]MDA9087906.1 deoxynucleoside kinase [Methylophilaceae bacterium]MDA9819041.1 deoxynucleoside kinase [Methylophilaceae bacterium]
MNIFNKYPYIVVEGPIGSGKSTLARLLANQFNANMFSEKAERNPFLPKFYEDMKHYALPTQLFFLFQRANQISELKQKDFFRNGVVADFFLQKDPIFARLNLDNEEFKLYDQIYRHLEIKAPTPDLVIYLQTPVDLLRARVEKRNIGYEQKISTEYLERIAESYSSYFHNDHNSNVLIVNNESLDILKDKSALNMLIERILSISSIREYFNPRLT